MGALTQLEYVVNRNLITIVPGTDFHDPSPSSDLQHMINQISIIIREYSWRMVFANDDAEFEELYQSMMEKVTALGYDEVFEFYRAAAEEKVAMIHEVLGR
jgi:multiple sugar transport system substrate-binding protein/putative aldouronate transport system substrate-binding protein